MAQTFSSIVPDSVYAQVLLFNRDSNIISLECGNFLPHPDSLRKELKRNCWNEAEIKRYFEKSSLSKLYQKLNAKDYLFFQQQVDACRIEKTGNKLGSVHCIFRKEGEVLKFDINNQIEISKFYILPLFNLDGTLAITYRSSCLLGLYFNR